MKIKLAIFKAYDIRGKYPAELNETTAEYIGNATAVVLAKKYRKERLTFLVCRDVRSSSESLKDALVRGISAQGSKIIDFGIGTTPFFYYLMNTQKVDGGLMVTASHNPPEYNGFKVRGRRSESISWGAGLEKIKALTLKKKLTEKRTPGLITTSGEERDEYIKFLSRGFIIKRIRTVVDASGGSTAFFLPKLLNAFPEVLYKPLFFEPDGTFQRHSPNPLLPGAQRYMQQELKNGSFRFGAIFDGDGDRVVFFDEKGETVRPEFILGLFAEEELPKHPQSTIVMPVNTSKAVREFIQEKGGKVKLSRIGPPFMYAQMKRTRAILGGEISGHFYFRDFFAIDSALLAWLKLASLLSQNPRPLSQLIKPFATYVSSGEINFEVKNKKAVLKQLQRYYRQGKISKLDGLTVEFPEWWFNLRPSNTEPLVRLMLEAKNQELFDEKLNRVEELVEKS